MKPNRILIVSNTNYRSAKMFLDQSWKFAKGFIRLGCDVKIFSYNSAVRMASPLKSKNFLRFFKSRADDTLIEYVKSYLPQIVLISFPEFLDYKSLQLIKDASPGSILIGFYGDPWPKLQKDNRI